MKSFNYLLRQFRHPQNNNKQNGAKTWILNFQESHEKFPHKIKNETIQHTRATSEHLCECIKMKKSSRLRLKLFSPSHLSSLQHREVFPVFCSFFRFNQKKMQFALRDFWTTTSENSSYWNFSTHFFHSTHLKNMMRCEKCSLFFCCSPATVNNNGGTLNKILKIVLNLEEQRSAATAC